jgi:hypothetical protein
MTAAIPARERSEFALASRSMGESEASIGSKPTSGPQGNTPVQVTRIDVFISSPSDVAEEREIVGRVIERLNRSVLRDHFFVVPLLYEQDVPPEVGRNAQCVVDRYMHVQRSQVMVCVLWSRMGTPFTITETGDRFDSGTQYEFITGYESFLHHGNPTILLYRRVQENAEADSTQKDRVAAFFDGFQGPQPRWKGLWKEYNEPAEFEERLRNDLERVIRGLQLEQQFEKVDRPEFQEEARRLDAAIPQVASLGEPTEVRAMICLPGSEGLRSLLPHRSEDHREIGKEDVCEGDLMIAFPKDRRSGELQSTPVSIQVEAPDFEVGEPRQSLLLSPCRDSVVAVVSLTPRRPREKSRVIVCVKAKALDGGEYLCGSAVLCTSVSATVVQRLGTTLWRLASLALGGQRDSGDPGAGPAGTIGSWEKHISQGDFTAAKKIADGLPESTPEERWLKQQLVGATASERYAAEYKPVVENTMADVQSLARAGRFAQARSRLNELRSDRQDLVDLKRNALQQLDEAEEKSREVRFVNDTMEEIRRLVPSHKVDAARKLAERLPYEVRDKVLPQLDQAEAHQKTENIVSQLRDLMAEDRFKEARCLLDDIPVHLSPDLAEVKQYLRGQIDEAESDYRKVESEIGDLMRKVSRKLARRGIDFTELARQNNVDLSNKRQLYGFLKAIDRQL